jgi:hypothetical protein
MQHFTFTLHDDVNSDSPIFSSLPNSSTTVTVSGELNLDTLCDYFTQFVRGCGYVLPENSRIGVTNEDF